MNARISLIFTLALYALLALLLYWVRPEEDTGSLGLNLVFLIAPLAAAVGGFFALRVYGLRGPRTAVFAFLTAGLACFFLGEALWTYFAYVAHTDPFPSAADVFYLLAYPFLFAGLVAEIRLVDVRWDMARAKVLLPMAVFGFFLMIVVGVFGIAQAYDPSASTWENVIAMGYGVMDLVLILTASFVLILAWEYRGGKFATSWTAFFFGLMLMLLADILFAINHEQYENGAWAYQNTMDSLWILSYLCMAIGLFASAFLIQDVQKRASVPAATVKG